MIQAAYLAEEWVDDSYKQMKEDEARCIAAVDAFNLAKQRIKDLKVKLTEANRNRKSAEAILEGVERQAESQC